MRRLGYPLQNESPVIRQNGAAMPAHLAGCHRVCQPITPAPLDRRGHRNTKPVAAIRQLSPAKTAATTRSRRSVERGPAIDAGLQSSIDLESQLTPQGIPRVSFKVKRSRASSPRFARSKQDLHPVRQHLRRCKTTRREIRALETSLHLMILLRTSANFGRNSSKCES